MRLRSRFCSLRCHFSFLSLVFLSKVLLIFFALLLWPDFINERKHWERLITFMRDTEPKKGFSFVIAYVVDVCSNCVQCSNMKKTMSSIQDNWELVVMGHSKECKTHGSHGRVNLTKHMSLASGHLETCFPVFFDHLCLTWMHLEFLTDWRHR